MPGAIPTPAKNWNTSKVNQAIAWAGFANATAQNMWMAIFSSISTYPTNPAICKGSSNSLTAGMDGVNRLINNAAFVGSTAGTAHSWIVFEFPQINDGAGGHRLQVCIDYSGASASDFTNNTMLYASANGYSGGTTSNRPTAADEQGFSGTQFCGVGTVGVKLHVLQSTDGKTWIIIVCSGGFPSALILIAAPAPTIDVVPTPGGWSYPWVIFFEASKTSGNVFTATFLASGTANKHFGRHASTSLPLAFAWEGATAYTSSTGAGNGPNSITGQPLMLGFGVWALSGSTQGRLGYLPDMFIVGDSVFAVAGATIGTDDNHRQWAVFGNLVVPWTNDATVPGTS